MVIFLNLDGSCENVSPQHVYQGSNNVTDITVIAPFPSTTALQIGFILPDGLYWHSDSDGVRYEPMEFVKQDIDNRVCVWRYVLQSSVTLQQGDLLIAINAVTSDGNTTSYLCKQEIEESVLPNLPSAPESSVYELLQLYLARLDGRTANVANLVASIQKVAPNAIAYTNNSGVTSAPIVIEGGDTAPIPINAASTIEIPEEAWQPVYSGQTVTGYTITITAAQHGQMRDGATVNDLWVSFDETENGVISGAYQGYTVSEDGDITISVNQPVAMTVRVWNGKGLVDEVAREMAEQETERAESEEKHLQEQITELQNTGVDVIARKQIAEEIERAEQAEQTLQENIDAETSRAEGAESDLQSQIVAETSRALEAEDVLASDIQGLREDVENESHFRGMFNSVANLIAAYPTATPNDYAYIVGGNIWIWQDNEWTDSNEPTPNTAIPLSDSTPLMDGVASAGTSSAASRSDHRHGSDTSKISKSGDTMTGALELPLLLGTDATDNRGIIPVRWLDRSEFGLASSDTLDKYLQAWIKKICVLYPNQQDCIFVGTGNPASRIMIQALIYDTSDVDSTGMPRYVIGMERRYGTNPAPFNVKNYIYSYGWDSFYIEKSSSALDVGVWRSDIDKRINISISSDGLKRGLWSNDHSWILYMDDNGVVYFNGADATAAKQGTVYGITESSGSNKTALGYGSRISGQLYTPTNCTVIGYQAVVQDVNNTTRTNNTALGYGATITNASNTIQLGNSSISTLNCKVGVTTTSDERDKIDITVIDNGKALEFICAVDPIQYVDNDRDKYLLRETIIDEETGETVYDENGENEKIYRSYGSCEYDREAHARGDKKGDRKRIGVSAQKTQEALMSIFGSDNYANIVNDNQYDLRADGIDIPVENRLTVCYERFVPLLIGAVKAQQKQIVALTDKINKLEEKNDS